MRLNLKMLVCGIGLLLAAVTVTAAGAAAVGPVVVVPERTRVCMVQDTVMAVPAIPLERDGKVYYGCCQMCKGKLAREPRRYTLARDPVSGKTVDKATAELLGVDGRVLYFESVATRDQFVRTLPGDTPSVAGR